jgi:hypothetical protein
MAMNTRDYAVSDSGFRVGGWLLAVFGAGALALMGAEDYEQGGPFTFSIQSALENEVLIDLRGRTRSGAVAAPIAKSLDAGSRVDFTIWAEREVCVRVIDRNLGLIRALHIPHAVPDGINRLWIRESLFAPSSTSGVRCDPALVQHPVRLELGKSFDPQEPSRVRREPILYRRPRRSRAVSA